ncbi:MAG: hypothetical protein V7L31_26965 [Nostoc sp.]
MHIIASKTKCSDRQIFNKSESMRSLSRSSSLQTLGDRNDIYSLIIK